ncbi:MAG: agmatine deiminase family protein [Planctomycetales bacterium]|nr:agmatine deiminase family protein [Planctomycetales bacterium]
MAREPDRRWRYLLTALAVLGILTAGYTFVLLNQANELAGNIKKDLDQSQRDLDDADQFASSSIDELDKRQMEFLIKSARRIQPSDAFSAKRTELKQALRDWLQNKRSQTRFSIHRARANYRLGQLHSLDGNNREAIRVLSDSIETASRNEDKVLACYARNTLACIRSTLGRDREALDLLNENAAILAAVPDEQIALALTLRNIGVLEQNMGENGIARLRESVNALQRELNGTALSITHEVMIDTQTTLAEMLYLRKDYDAAEAVCQAIRNQLEAMLKSADNVNVGDDATSSSSRYRNAIACVDHNLAALKKADSSIWRWIPLVDMSTETIQSEPEIKIKAVAEFESQSAVVLAWGSYQWAHDVVLDIAAATHKQWRIDLVADNDEAMEEAVEAFREAAIPTDQVRFGVVAYEVPWFRDFGPIVARSTTGQAVWFDSHQLRFDNFDRPVNDCLPRILSTRWNARLIKTPLHIEGGTILSNGNGFTICSTSVIDDNIDYGFDLETIKQRLTYVTGATAILPVEPLMGELTGHLDLFMAFTDPTTLVVCDLQDENDPNRLMLDALANQISSLDVNGHAINVVRIPMPTMKDGLVRSYTNVVFANGVLLVPSYQGVDEKIGQQVKSIYQKLLPTWEIKFIDCTSLATKGGALHCLSANLGPTPYLPVGKYRNRGRQAADP